MPECVYSLPVARHSNSNLRITICSVAWSRMCCQKRKYMHGRMCACEFMSVCVHASHVHVMYVYASAPLYVCICIHLFVCTKLEYTHGTCGRQEIVCMARMWYVGYGWRRACAPAKVVSTAYLHMCLHA